MGTGAVAAQGLLEREQELDALSTALAAARDGRGSLLVLEGSAGIGKSRLVDAARDQAREQGLTVVSAQGGELERDFPFGVVRQLFEPVLARLSEGERTEALAGAARLAAGLFAFGDESPEHPSDETSGPVLHGLYWLMVNLVQRGPLLVTVDDAHWCDAPSLRWLDYVARRLEGLPVLVLAAMRPVASDDGEAAPLVAFPEQAAATVVHPNPLSRTAVAELVRGRLSADADERFCDACHAATLGNPFYVGELLGALASDGLSPTSAAAARVETLGPPAIARAVFVRLARLSPQALALSRAVAILGEHAALGRAAAAAGLSAADAAEAADALAAADVLDADGDLRFRHPIVRTSVYADVPPGERALSHATAARVLSAENAPAAEVAVHLLATEPAGDPWVVDALADAARRALAHGAPEAAASYLTRALTEPPSDPDDRARLLAELGRAEAQARVPAAIEHLGQALDRTSDPVERARVALELGRALTMAERLQEAVDVLDRARLDLNGEDTELGKRLDAELIDAARMNLATRSLGAKRLAELHIPEQPDSLAGRALLAHSAFEGVVSGRPAGEAAARAGQALSGGLIAEDGMPDPAFYVASYALALCDRTDEAEGWLDDALARTRRAGSAVGFATASCFKAISLMRRGDVSAAEANARTALELRADQGWRILLPMSMGVLVNALIERGQIADAAAALAEAEIEADPGSMSFTVLLFSRGRLKLLQGDVTGARDDLLDCGRKAIEWGSRTPTFFPWRSTAALVLNATGDRDEAVRLVEEEVEMARAFGAPTPIGLSLTAAGLIREGDAGAEALHEAIAVLERGPAQLAYARALTLLGTRMRVSGDEAGAREPLRTALDLAHRCGATALADQAHAELVATGARPRRPALSGSAALTPSERRVAGMAADGLTNADIAQGLFVTPRTVEQHLTSAYRKLGITSRADLRTALAR